MNILEIIEELTQALQQTGNSKAVFGDPIKLESKTVIPVAEISINFGGGGNFNPSAQEEADKTEAVKSSAKSGGKKTAKSRKSKKDNNDKARSGLGAGLMLRTTPVGYIIEQDGEVVFIPIKIQRDSRLNQLSHLIMNSLPLFTHSKKDKT